VQTFLPFDSFTASAAVLDDKRLGKQRVETMQIMTALVEGRGWINHPATKMWKGFECALMEYQWAVCEEWTSRTTGKGIPFKDTCLNKTAEIHSKTCNHGAYEYPSWLGNEEFHLSHQSNLIRKDPTFYRPEFPGVPSDLEYVWPVG
jgi:hypothetical protein